MLLQPKLVKAQVDKPIPLTRLLKSSAPNCSVSVLADIFSFFCQVPGAAPVAAVGSEFYGGAGGGDLVLCCGEGGAFGGVFALAADRTFGGAIHCKPHRGFLAFAVPPRVLPSVACRIGKSNHLPTRPIAQLLAAETAQSVACRNLLRDANLLAVLSWVFLTPAGDRP